MLRNRIRAFTLTEILVCLAIIVALASITFSVIAGAKRGGKANVEINQMHQIGLAANLYHEQNDAWPISTQELVGVKLIPASICLSPLDRFPSGLSNAWLVEEGRYGMTAHLRKRVASFPNTYLSIGDANGGKTARYEREMNEQENFGLFVSLTGSKSFPSSEGLVLDGPFTGTYRRVLLDGSVVTRKHLKLRGRDSQGKPIKFSTGQTMWFDPSDQWIEAYARTF